MPLECLKELQGPCGGACLVSGHSAGARGTTTTTSTSVMADDYVRRILLSSVYDVCRETQLQPAPALSASLGADIFLKREDLQPVFSFKLRGAYNLIRSLSPERLAKGVVTCSAGNHAQGVAYSAYKLGIDATIVMPSMTPAIKVAAVRTFGGPRTTVLLHGENFDEAAAEARRLVETKGMTMIHPFDDPAVIAGQGTIGMEVVKATAGGSLDAIFCCCGGGGMLAGVAAYVKRVRPETLVIGVEADDAASMTASLIEGKVVELDSVGLFADGAAVRVTGNETFRVANDLADAMITVTTDEICQAIQDGFNATRTVMEPAGILAVAGMKKVLKGGEFAWARDPEAVAEFVAKASAVQAAGGSNNSPTINSTPASMSMDSASTPHAKRPTVVAVTSGANMDFTRLRFISERADASESLLAVEIPERPGAFRSLYSVIFPRNVTEFSYRYADNGGAASIIISFRVLGPGDLEHVTSELEKKGFGVWDMGSNELCKSHVRYLAGGRSPTAGTERLFRFEFPEKPGALNKFLESLDKGFNVSLFHYRNHGDDFGRVLVGIQPEVVKKQGRPSVVKVQPRDARDPFEDFLANLGYHYVEETNNPARARFL
eukprot:m.92967 g.92967  ORF g.92967 m.92967 type:complete len:605 (-) comp9982_c0_seq1:269-2083(-)